LRDLKRLLPRLQITELVVFILILVVAGIAAMIGLNVLDNVDNSFTAGSLEANASTDAKQGIANLTEQFPNIGLVVAAVVIIGLLVAGFAFAFRGGGGF
jgi:hypothetical protein